jgi:hypothetical protein
MTAPYPAVVKDAIDRGQLQQVTRRVEFYESDGVTPWQPTYTDRLIGGSVGLNYGDNERRTMDVTLRNDDNALRSQSSGFWYDKVLKLYRGVKYSPNVVIPKVVVIESVGGATGSGAIIARLARIGFPGAVWYQGAISLDELMKYDIIVSYSGTASTSYLTLLNQLYGLGKTIMTISNANVIGVVPFLTGGAAQTNRQWGISQLSPAGSLSAGWGTEAVGSTANGVSFTGVSSGGVALARYTVGTTSNTIAASMGLNQIGGKWFDLRIPSLGGTNVTQLMANVADYFKQGYGSWETQLGEFVIDGISSAYFPSDVKVTGRDYVKRVLNSKVENAVTFDAGTSISTLITALATNAGVKKFRLATMPESLNASLSFDRGTPRWEVIVAAAKTQGYEIFFDYQGYLATRKYLDPTNSAENYLFTTGASGNLSDIQRAVNDSRIYNHVVVYGDPASGEQRMPYVGEAKNTNSSSPTRISKLGDRYYSYASTFFTSQTQTQEYANRLLGLHSLESFELSFQAINYPWMEAGEIARVEDPKAVTGDPTKYLIDSATIPLDLGPMSFTGKRVVIV